MANRLSPLLQYVRACGLLAFLTYSAFVSSIAHAQKNTDAFPLNAPFIIQPTKCPEEVECSIFYLAYPTRMTPYKASQFILSKITAASHSRVDEILRNTTSEWLQTGGPAGKLVRFHMQTIHYIDMMDYLWGDAADEKIQEVAQALREELQQRRRRGSGRGRGNEESGATIDSRARQALEYLANLPPEIRRTLGLNVGIEGTLKWADALRRAAQARRVMSWSAAERVFFTQMELTEAKTAKEVDDSLNAFEHLRERVTRDSQEEVEAIARETPVPLPHLTDDAQMWRRRSKDDKRALFDQSTRQFAKEQLLGMVRHPLSTIKDMAVGIFDIEGVGKEAYEGVRDALKTNDVERAANIMRAVRPIAMMSGVWIGIAGLLLSSNPVGWVATGFIFTAVILGGGEYMVRREAAARAKTMEEFEKQAALGAQALASTSMNVVLIAVGGALKGLGKIPRVQQTLKWIKAQVPLGRLMWAARVARVQEQLGTYRQTVMARMADTDRVFVQQEQVLAQIPDEFVFGERLLAGDPLLQKLTPMPVEQLEQFRQMKKTPAVYTGAARTLWKTAQQAVARRRELVATFREYVMSVLDIGSQKIAATRNQAGLNPAFEFLEKRLSEQGVMERLYELNKEQIKKGGQALADELQKQLDAGTQAAPASTGVKAAAPEVAKVPASESPNTETEKPRTKKEMRLSRPVQEGDVGSYSELHDRSPIRDGLEIHHMPFNALLDFLKISGLNRQTAISIVLKERVHARTFDYRGRAPNLLKEAVAAVERGQPAPVVFRRFLRRSIQDLRKIAAEDGHPAQYDVSIEKAIQHWKEQFPSLMEGWEND